MSGRSLVITAGLMCVCVAVGCASGPSRNFFSRRAKSSTSEDEFVSRLMVDAKRLEKNGDREGANQLRDQANAVAASAPSKRQPLELPDDVAAPLTNDVAQTKPSSTRSPLSLSDDSGATARFQLDDDSDDFTKTLRESPQKRSGGGQFGVSGRTSIEAPAPKRRSRALDDSGESMTPRLMPADYQTTNDFQADIVPAGASRPSERAARNATNPWNQYRGLTKPLGNDLDLTNRSGSVTWPTDPEDFRSSAPQSNGTPSQELWPRAPGAIGYAPANGNTTSNAQGWTDTLPVGVPTAPSSIQPTNGEQSSFTASTIPGFNDSPQQAPTAGPLDTQAPASDSVLFPLPNGAPATIAPFAVSPDLDRLIVQTAAEAAAMIPGENETERQAYLRKHVQLRLLHLIAGQMDRALQPVPSVDPADQEFWQQMLWGVANYFDVQGMPDSSERATQTISQLKSATMRLQEKARMELHNVAFCHKITSFGSFQRFKRDEFTPGQPVLLYAEVTNFKSEPTSDGQFRTLMKSSVEVFEGGIHGRMIESIPFAPSEDRCRNYRRDYFHSYEFAIPQGISSGPHVLRLTVEDQLGKKTSVTTLNFTVQ